MTKEELLKSIRESTAKEVRAVVVPLVEAVQALRVEVAGLHESRADAVAKAVAAATRDVKAIHNEVVRRLSQPSKH